MRKTIVFLDYVQSAQHKYSCFYIFLTFILQKCLLKIGFSIDKHSLHALTLKYTPALGSLGHSVTDHDVQLVGASGGCYALIGAHLASVIVVSLQSSYSICFKFTKLIQHKCTWLILHFLWV